MGSLLCIDGGHVPVMQVIRVVIAQQWVMRVGFGADEHSERTH